MQDLRVLCSGTGYFSQYHYDAWQRVPEAMLVGVCNRSIAKAKAFASRYDIPHVGDQLEMLIQECEPDLLDIITPPETHRIAVETAARNKVHAVCQKPFGRNLNEARELVNIAKMAGIQLIVHENFRFMPWFREIKNILDSKVLGDVLNVTFALRPGDGQGEDAYLARQPYFQKMPRFLVHETAIHLIDTFRYLLGEPHSVYAQLRRCNPAIAGEDAGLLVFQFGANTVATFDGNRLLDHASTNTRRTMGELRIEGTSGSLNLDGEGRIWLREFDDDSWLQHKYSWQDIHFGGDCVYSTIAHISAHFVSGADIENTAVDYLKNIEIEEAVYHSSAEGRRVDFV